MLKRVFVVITAVAAFGAMGGDAEACSCFAPIPCGTVAAADAVFVATVERLDPLYQTNDPRSGELPIGQIAHLAHVQPLRGTAGTTILGGSGRGDCGFVFTRGVRYFIVASRDQNGRLGTSLCSLTRPAIDAAGLIAYAESLSKPSDRGRLFGRVSVGPHNPRGGSGLGGATVAIRGLITESTTTDIDGNYLFLGVPLGQYTIGVTPPPDRKGLRAMPDQRAALDRTNACALTDFYARNDGRITGGVVDGRAAPIAGLLVSLQPVPYIDGESLVFGATTDSAGRYAFGDVPEGRYRVGINFDTGPSGRLPYSISAARTPTGNDIVAVGPGESVALSPLVLAPLDSLYVDVRVMSPDGTPADNVLVYAVVVGSAERYMAAEAKTPIAPGHFQMTLHRDTAYRYRVVRASSVLHTVDAAANETSIVITLPK